eukprot:5206283-Prymnesium_polylepis.1
MLHVQLRSLEWSELNSKYAFKLSPLSLPVSVAIPASRHRGARTGRRATRTAHTEGDYLNLLRPRTKR